MTGHLDRPPHLVLLGDSIFDNAAYVPDGLPVIEHLRQTIPSDWQATLLAIDGDITSGVVGQTSDLPSSATHLIISVGGNDALQQLGVINEPVNSVGEALLHFAGIRENFRRNYRQMLAHVLSLNLPVTVCTVYNSVPGLGGMEKTALALFNEIILHEAFMVRVPVIDLRLICNEDEDYSHLSPIEPSHAGGNKIARAIIALLYVHDFNVRRSTIIPSISSPECGTNEHHNISFTTPEKTTEPLLSMTLIFPDGSEESMQVIETAPVQYRRQDLAVR